MMKSQVFNIEMTIYHLKVGSGAAYFVNQPSSMNHFMSHCSIDGTMLGCTQNIQDKSAIVCTEVASAYFVEDPIQQVEIKCPAYIKGRKESFVFFHDSSSIFRVVEVIHWKKII